MRRFLVLFGFLLVLAAVLLLFSTRTGFQFGQVRVSTSADASYLEQRTVDFLEDLRFKDFEKAASYHSIEDRRTVRIPELIERIFQIKPEFLDILRYEVLAVELDRSRTRARVRTRTVVKLLNTSEIREPEILFYWHKDPRDGWVMKLESSLR